MDKSDDAAALAIKCNRELSVDRKLVPVSSDIVRSVVARRRSFEAVVSYWSLAPGSRYAHAWPMRTAFALVFLFLPAALAVQTISTGRWDVTSTVVDLDIPGAPGFLVRMMKGKSKSERKCISPALAAAGVAALLAPDPKAQCRIDSQEIGDGRYSQALTCPQKQGAPIKIMRAGTYDASGFSGQLHMGGETPKGVMHVTLDQKATQVPGSC